MECVNDSTCEATAINFKELIEYGKANGANIVDDMPWSFKYKGFAVSHENDECYLITTACRTLRMTPNDMLIYFDGQVEVCSIEMFKRIYRRV